MKVERASAPGTFSGRYVPVVAGTYALSLMLENRPLLSQPVRFQWEGSAFAPSSPLSKKLSARMSSASPVSSPFKGARTLEALDVSPLAASLTQSLLSRESELLRLQRLLVTQQSLRATEHARHAHKYRVLRLRAKRKFQQQQRRLANMQEKVPLAVVFACVSDPTVDVCYRKS